MPINLVTSEFSALTTAGSRPTHSLDCAALVALVDTLVVDGDVPILISSAYWEPNNLSDRILLNLSTIP